MGSTSDRDEWDSLLVVSKKVDDKLKRAVLEVIAYSTHAPVN